MNFSPRPANDEPEINLIPLIDILLVVLIFMAATTTFTRLSQLNVALPQAHSQAVVQTSIEIAISQNGHYALDEQLLPESTLAELVASLAHAKTNKPDAPLLINADAQSSHESVIRVMEAAQQAGIERINFATQAR